MLSDGSYSWVMPTTTDYGMSYLSSFYDAGISFPSEQTIGASYKGFNDSLAAWGSDRVMGQQCGQTWLQTFSEINGLYDAGKQLPDLQLVTWNDYEEATEIESGIDNCLTVSGSVAGSALAWKTTGDENTVDHYTVYISSDGQNLMPLTNMATGTDTLNLCSFSIPGGNYKLFVQAVGKPSLANQITGAISYSPACGAATGSSTLSFSASPPAATIPAGKSGNFTVTAKPQSGSFNHAITLSCSGLPSGLSCAFSPVTITPGAAAGTSTLTISSVAVTGMDLPQRSKWNPIYAGWLLSFGIAGFAFIGNMNRGRSARVLTLLALMVLGMITVSCGGGTAGAKTAATAAPSNYSVTIVGNSNSTQFSTAVNITVQ